MTNSPGKLIGSIHPTFSKGSSHPPQNSVTAPPPGRRCWRTVFGMEPCHEFRFRLANRTVRALVSAAENCHKARVPANFQPQKINFETLMAAIHAGPTTISPLFSFDSPSALPVGRLPCAIISSGAGPYLFERRTLLSFFALAFGIRSVRFWDSVCFAKSLSLKGRVVTRVRVGLQSCAERARPARLIRFAPGRTSAGLHSSLL
jgi:hypothetical protein